VEKEIAELKKENEKFELEKKELKGKIFQGKLKEIIIIVFIVFEIIFLTSLLFKHKIIELKKETKDKVGIINFNKQITSESIKETISLLDEAKKQENIKEILFIMNSPGGSPAASEELSEYLKEINKEKKITMYIESVAASGGYYIASAIKPLKANKNAIVGSIGVIIQHYSLEELSKKIGIEEDNVAYGEYKQPISLFKPIDEKSKKYLEDNLLSPMYQNFINSIVENRNVKKEIIEEHAEGKIYLANDKRIQGILIDEITNLYKVKEEISNKYNNKIEFIELEKKENVWKDLLKGSLDINLNTDSNISNKLK
jgi:protease-4